MIYTYIYTYAPPDVEECSPTPTIIIKAAKEYCKNRVKVCMCECVCL